ncbi:histidinol-phosphatase [Corynebacterium pseudotuberculosis]|uniref:histidinol-phosphatase n=1 Tax=Corynebacterium pseudotuberculosis TaxID=1719 RepID=UPI0034E2477A
MTSYDSDLDFALSLADAADAITFPRFESADLVVDSKPDMTPVSDADLACEKALRELITARYPDDAILGEEFGGDVEFKGRQWVIDPIDATKNFVRGVPAWATLIALLVDGTPVVGVVTAPALARRWWAASGRGAWRTFNGGTPTKLSVSRIAHLDNASLSFSSLSGWQSLDLDQRFIDLTERTWRLRGFGDFWSYCLVAEGAVDIAAEPEVSLWDLAPLVVLVEEAGGTFTSLTGEPGPHGGSAVASNALLHDAALDILGTKTQKPSA